MTAPTPLDLRLYFVCGSDDSAGRPLHYIVGQATAAGVTLIQLREKSASTRDFIKQARAVVAAAGSVPVIINDRVDVALAAKAHGVHVGQSDMSPVDARRILGDSAIIGLTVHDAGEIDRAPIGSLDYLSIGGVFATTSKDNPSPPLGVDRLSGLVDHARSRCQLPICAIAGIGLGNIDAVVGAGVDGVAVVSAIGAAQDVAAASAALLARVT